MDQQSWVSIHSHLVENWQLMSLLLSLHQFVDVTILDNLKIIMVYAMVLYGGLN
jgi:hypothetical protein